MLAVGSTAFSAPAGPTIRNHEITVRIDPEKHRLEATDRVTFEVGATTHRVVFTLHRDLKISAASYKGESVTFRSPPDGPPEPEEVKVPIEFIFPRPLKPGKSHTIEARYQGEIHDPPRAPRFLRYVTPSETSGYIGPEGVYLGGETGWYLDVPEALFRSSVTISLPQGWEAVSEGSEKKHEVGATETTARWESGSALEAITVAAGRFVVDQRSSDRVLLRTYLSQENASLSGIYLDAAEKYLETYSGLLGSYPFPKFAIVENFFSSGYGLPSFTLLGSQVIRRRYTQPYALGHEIVHSWIGNSVLNDAGGNWVEGLTTYLANYLYDELTGDAKATRESRRRMAMMYAINVPPAEDYPIHSFRRKISERDDAIGYQKTAMFFFMLHQEVGKGAFDSALRDLARHRGQRLGWKDLEKIFADGAGRDLGLFFREWVEHPGAPELSVEAAAQERSEGWIVAGRLQQREPLFHLTVPIEVEGTVGTVKTEVRLERSSTAFELKTAGRPVRLAVDPGYTVFRRWRPTELPPNLNGLLADAHRQVVIPSGGAEEERSIYEEIAERLREVRRIPEKNDQDLTDPQLREAPLFLLGGPGVNRITAALSKTLADAGLEIGPDRFSFRGQVHTDPAEALLITIRDPARPDRLITLFYGLSVDAIRPVAPLLFFYGWDSYHLFRSGRITDRGVLPPAEQPLVITFPP